jgi:hypothetical protein
MPVLQAGAHRDMSTGTHVPGGRGTENGAREQPARVPATRGAPGWPGNQITPEVGGTGLPGWTMMGE